MFFGLIWWAANDTQYHNLSKFAKIYQHPAAVAVCTAKNFSEAGLVYKNRRNRLLPFNAEKIVFMHQPEKILFLLHINDMLQTGSIHCYANDSTGDALYICRAKISLENVAEYRSKLVLKSSLC
ncbi:unnamed protein product [Parnassius mnemosyne]|uniref:HAT C-terminal dimerisation domain-containing protein n=1 Tax=Parnassius mnemosyne TaxID=213953 RepID=A0AAV1KK08_9NEOP